MQFKNHPLVVMALVVNDTLAVAGEAFLAADWIKMLESSSSLMNDIASRLGDLSLDS